MAPALVIALAAMSAYGSMQANKKNADAVDRSNRMNQKMQEQQNAFNLAMWNKQNAYNHPLEQKKRFEQAGLNPALMLGQFNAGQAESLTSASASPAGASTYENPLAGLSDAVSVASNAKLSEEQASLVRSQKQRQDIENSYLARVYEADLSNKDKDGRLKDKQIDHYAAQTDAQLLKNTFDAEMNPILKEELRARVDKLKEEKDVLDLQKQLLQKDLDMSDLKKQEFVAQIGSLYANIRYLSESTNMTREQANLLKNQSVKVFEEGLITREERKAWRIVKRQTMDEVDARIRSLDANTVRTNKETDMMREEMNANWFEKTIRLLGFGVSAYAMMRGR